MKLPLLPLWGALLLMTDPALASSIGTAFNYQGQLTDAGTPASGSFAGGQNNTASGYAAFVGGGWLNPATGIGSVVGGGGWDGQKLDG